jgi:hypothetical protein
MAAHLDDPSSSEECVPLVLALVEQFVLGSMLAFLKTFSPKFWAKILAMLTQYTTILCQK